MDYKMTELEKTLSLACEMCDEPYNFGQHVLELLAKYYEYDHISFVPACPSQTGLNSLYAQKPIFYGFPAQANYDYVKDYYFADPFRLHNLPKRLLGNEILTMQDIPEYAANKVVYGEFLRKNNLYDHMCAYLIADDICLGGICMYRKVGSPLFNELDKSTMKTQAQFISRHYRNSISLGAEAFQKVLYKSFFEQMSAGIIILDSDFNILDYNEMADEFCRQIFESKNKESANTFESMAKSLRITAKASHFEHMAQLISYCLKDNPDQDIHFDTGTDSFLIKFKANVVPSKLFEMQPFCFIQIERIACEQTPCASQEKLYHNYNLTLREIELVRLMVQGYSNQNIAEELGISLHTTKTHIKNIFSKLGVSSRSKLIYKFLGE